MMNSIASSFTPVTDARKGVLTPVEERRQALQSRIKAVVEAGALANPSVADAGTSVAQWSNWLNG